MFLQVENIHKSFPTNDGPLQVLRGVSFTLEKGKTLALTGESGSGKSTLLHLIGALDRPDSGNIRLGNTSLATLGDRAAAELRRGRIGLIFQQFNLIPSLTVAGNLAFQARLAGVYDSAHCTELAATLGLSDLLDRFPEQLSGGQQQRVAIGRALAANPEMLLADEPTGNLDEANGDVVLDLMLSLVDRMQTTFLMVTHSTRLAARMDRRIHLSAGQVT